MTPRPHRSTLASHPDIREVLPLFIARLPDQVRKLREFYDAGNTVELRRLLHQLKGSGMSYGFGQITTLAEGLERSLLAGPLAALKPELAALIDYIVNIDGYNPT